MAKTTEWQRKLKALNKEQRNHLHMVLDGKPPMKRNIQTALDEATRFQKERGICCHECLSLRVALLES